MQFVAADHLNSLPSERLSIHPLEMVSLNLQVGEKAVNMSAFVPASRYLRKAVGTLEEKVEDPWGNHFELSLRVYRAASDVELCLGNFDRGSVLCDELVDNSNSVTQRL